MTDILYENMKLILLFAWIAAVIVLSHVGQAAPAPRKSRRAAPAATAAR
jgi:hypothetical protein